MGKDKLGKIAALYRKSGVEKRMAMLCGMNFSIGLLQGMEVLIYMNFFEKLHVRKSSTRDIPFTKLAKAKNAEFPGSKCIHHVKNYPLTISVEEGGFL